MSLGAMLPPLQTAATILPDGSFLTSIFHPSFGSTEITSAAVGNSASMRTVGIFFSLGTRMVYFWVAPGADSFGRTATCAWIIAALTEIQSSSRDDVDVLFFNHI